jgi:hypothetical protein
LRFHFATNVWHRPASFLAAVAVLTAVRLGHLSLNQWDLMFDEAQYWLWSLSPDWGYYSKPPLIAWAVWFTTQVCGHTEWCVRLASPVAHAIASIGVYCCARLLFAPRVPVPSGAGLINAVYPRQQPDREGMPPEARAERLAFWSGLLYATASGVSLSSTLISTDPFLLLFWAWSLYFFLFTQSTNLNRMRADSGCWQVLPPGWVYLASTQCCYSSPRRSFVLFCYLGDSHASGRSVFGSTSPSRSPFMPNKESQSAVSTEPPCR